MMRVSGQGAPVAGRLWRVAVVAAAAAIGSVAEAEAALYYWSDSDSGYSRPGPATAPRRQPKSHRHQARKIEAPEKETAKPQGPLIIAISIEKQSLKIYDSNGFFAESPVSTGMKGHPTPMGVFSVIQKHKLHHSNIYSNAPMPYMQRITWSGVAMHAGVLPGYPASHGCIRMPMAFAMKMWNWTKMGARVVVTPGEVTPSNFSHPLLVTQKVGPQPAAEPQADAPPAPKPDKASAAEPQARPAISVASLELRSSLGRADEIRLTIGQAPTRTRTADASGDMPSAQPSATITDTTPAPPAEAASGGVKTDAEAAAAKPAESIAADDKPAETVATDAADKKTDEAVATPSSDETAKAEVTATGSTEAKTAAQKPEAKSDEAKVEATKPDTPQSVDKPDVAVKEPTRETPKTVTNAAPAPDAAKDQERVPDPAKPAAAKPDKIDPPKRAGQIAVFVSRKDSKLYVRQNFAPLFEAPVTIAASDRPLGTHVFTAEIDRNDANLVHWSVLSLPAPRHAERRDDDDRATRRRKIAGAAVEAKVSPEPDSPAEALDRLAIPAAVMARITDALSTGASIVVSDQGINGGETGEGTDFIVSLR